MTAPTLPRGPQRSSEELGLGWLSLAGDRAVSVLMIGLILAGGLGLGVATAVKPIVGVGVAALIGGALLVMRRLEIGGLVLVTVVPIFSGLRSGLPVPSLKLSEALIAGIGGLVLVTLRKLHARPWTRVEWTLGIFVALYFLLGLLDASELHAKLTFAETGTLLGPLQYFLLYRTIRLVLPTRRLQLGALRCLLYASVPISLIGVAQQLGVSAVRSFIVNITASTAVNSGSASGYSSFARASSLWPQWTLFAGYLTVVITLGLAIVLDSDADVIRRSRLYPILILDGIALFLTAELSAIASLVIAMVLLAWWSKRLGLLLKVVGVVLLVLGSAAGPYIAARVKQEYSKTVGAGAPLVPQTIQYRGQIWTSQYFPAIGERPILGWGVIQPPVVSWPSTESQYVTVLMRGGTPLLVAFVLMMGGVGSAAGALRRDPDDEVRRVSGRAVLALVIILIPMDTVFPYFEDSGLPEALWALVGIMMAAVPRRLPPLGFAALPSVLPDVEVPATVPADEPRLAPAPAPRPRRRRRRRRGPDR